MRLISTLALATACLCGPATAKPVPYRQLHRPAVPTDPAPPARVVAANAAALQEPRSDAFLNAIQVYGFSDGALYRLYTAPDRVSDITLQPGEVLTAMSAGDTARWVIGNTTSGGGETLQVHVLVKPYVAGLKTNLVITTNRRTYHVQMESMAQAAMTAMCWTYPQETLMALKVAQAKAEVAAPIVSGIQVEALNFRYAMTGDKPAWRPEHVFDDGQKAYIQFPKTIAQSEMPPLFAIGRDGKAELLNYRVKRDVLIVDRLFEVGELRLGTKHQAIVRIRRLDTLSAGGGHD